MSQQKRWLTLLTTISFLATTNGQQKCPGDLTCGKNAVCEYTYNGVNCACENGYSGDPKVECKKIKCSQNDDCPSPLRCVNEQCKDLCHGMCGKGALCNIKKDSTIPICSCPHGHTGNPLVSCRELGPREVCEMGNICGNNTNCRVGKDRSTAICSCMKGYKGNPLKACEPECHSNKECEDYQECLFPGCRDVCNPNPCGKDAYCKHKAHQAECECPYNRIGDPWVGCYAECKSSNDCPYDRPVCFNDLCINPCVKSNGRSACGEHATCTIKGETAICSCPKGFTGNALEKCRPILASEICKMVSCGEKAICTPHKQNDGHFVALCSCPPRHKGNALKQCLPVQCDKHEDCPANKNCRDWKCVNPCPGSCGRGANCEVNKKHVIICSCPPETSGNPLQSCRPREE